MSNLSYNGRSQELEIAKVTRRISTSAAPRVFLCAGVKSSGSTWLYNVVIAILKQRYRSGVVAFYADNFAMIPPGTERARFLVIKSHEPSKALAYLMRLTRGEIFVTLREPRDVIASLLQRFGHSFEGALTEIERQAARTVELADQENVRLFRYEAGFTEKSTSIDRIARILGVQLDAVERERIRHSLTRDAVKKKIGDLKKKGKFGAKPNADSFDVSTQWHPGHVGDGSIGKYKKTLTAAEQKRVLSSTRRYRKRFGYLPARKR